jgi:hypothetical protein
MTTGNNHEITTRAAACIPHPTEGLENFKDIERYLMGKAGAIKVFVKTAD